MISGLETLPGITQFKGPVPVRVTNVQLMSPYVIDKSWAGVTNSADDSGTHGKHHVFSLLRQNRAASDIQETLTFSFQITLPIRGRLQS